MNKFVSIENNYLIKAESFIIGELDELIEA
jgi:hypothetical protein